MIIKKVKRLFKKSLTRKIYLKIKAMPPIRLFFDFNYASRLWRSSFIGSWFEKAVNKTGIYNGTNQIKINEKYLPYLLCSCIATLHYQEFIIVPLSAITAALFVPYVKNKNLGFVLILSLIGAMLFAIYAPFSVFFYIIYVETGIILFFIVKYSQEKVCVKFIELISILWLVGALLGISSNMGALTVAVMPYAIKTLKRDGIRKYIYVLVMLGVGFYVLSKEGQGAVIGGSAGIALMLLSGEFWLIVPVVLTAPAVISFTMGVLDENIIRTGYFFWKYGFGGGAINYAAVSGGREELKIISYIFAPLIFVFFWYVLRVSRSAFVKLFKKKTKNGRFLRSGLASIIGFSIYTFFEYNQYFAINIILYLLSAALLKRTEGVEE